MTMRRASSGAIHSRMMERVSASFAGFTGRNVTFVAKWVARDEAAHFSFIDAPSEAKARSSLTSRSCDFACSLIGITSSLYLNSTEPAANP